MSKDRIDANKEHFIYIAVVGTKIQPDSGQPFHLDSIKDNEKRLKDPIGYALYCECFGQSKDPQWEGCGRFPDRLYLMATSASADNARRLKTLWDPIIQEIKIETVDGFDLIGTMDWAAQTIDQEQQEHVRFVVNFSSGTNPMQAGAFTRAVERNLLGAGIELVYVQEYANVNQAEEYGSQGRKGDFESMVLHRIQPLRLYYDHLIRRGLELFRRFHYEQSEAFFSQAANLANDESSKHHARAYQCMAHANTLWDNFQYRDVFNYIRKHSEHLKDHPDPLVQKLTRKRAFLFKFQRDVENHPTLFDITAMWENAVREFARGRLDKVALHLYRSFEMLLEWRLHSHYRFFQTQSSKYPDWWNDAVEKFGEVRKIWHGSQGKKKKKGKRQVNFKRSEDALRQVQQGQDVLYLKDMEAILNGMKDPMIRKINSELPAGISLYHLRQLRNSLPPIHGLETTEEIDVHTLKDLLRAACRVIEWIAKESGLTAEWDDLRRIVRPYEYDPDEILQTGDGAE